MAYLAGKELQRVGPQVVSDEVCHGVVLRRQSVRALIGLRVRGSGFMVSCLGLMV